MKENKLTQLLLVLFLTALLSLQFFKAYEQQDQARLELSQKFASLHNPFSAIAIGAESAIVMDLDTANPIYIKHPDKPRPIASITKLMTADIALRNIDPNEPIVITKEALAEEGNNGLRLGEQWSAQDLITFMLVESSNDAAYAIQMHLDAKNSNPENTHIRDFISLMNARSKELSLKTLSFQNPSGLDTEEKTPTAFASARESVFLLADTYKAHPEVIGETRKEFVTFMLAEGAEHIAENTNEAVLQLPGLLASKTGFTDSAGGNLVILFQTREGRNIGISVLGSSVKGRFTDIQLLAQATNAYFASIASAGLMKYYPW